MNLDKNGLNGQKLTKSTEVDQDGQEWTKMDQTGLKWSGMDQINQNAILMCLSKSITIINATFQILDITYIDIKMTWIINYGHIL